MSDKTEDIIKVDISKWVEKAKRDPKAYLERQATEVFLTALGMAKPFSHEVFLKGGILMGVVYQSPRQTGDIDFTTIMQPNEKIADEIRDALAKTFPRATAELGYPDLLCAVQSSRYLPSEEMFPKASGPALKIKIGYALRGSRQEKNFKNGNASDVLEVDISFREPVGAIQIVQFDGSAGMVRAYSLYDLIAEKLRALLQQSIRNRYRRQDIYDLDLLISKFSFNDDEMLQLTSIFKEKCISRNFIPNQDSLSDPEIIRRAKEQWDTLGLEIEKVPSFDECFSRVNDFYKSLPWSE